MLVINQIMVNCVTLPSLNSHSSRKSDKQRALRIHCMAWAPLLDLNNAKPVGNDRTDVDEGRANGQHALKEDSESYALKIAQNLPAEIPLTPEVQLLALADDYGKAYVLRVNSPFTNHSHSWGADVLEVCSIPKPRLLTSLVTEKHQLDDYIRTTRSNVQDAESQVNPRPSLLAAAMEERDHVGDMLWSPWRVGPIRGGCSAILTTRRDGALFHSKFFVECVEGTMNCSFEDPVTRIVDPLEPNAGSTIWCQLVSLVRVSSEQL